MNARAQMEELFNQYSENELIFASKVYSEHFSEAMTEAAYYKNLSRMCKSGYLHRLSKGVYCRPEKTRFGVTLPSDSTITQTFTENEQGVVIGYSLYNALGLTTQISKYTEIYSALLEEKVKQIGSILLKRHILNYSEDSCMAIKMLEILYHYKEIEDINNAQFIKYCQQFASQYNDSIVEYILQHISYPKWTIAFLREVLDYYHVENNLSQYLSSLSEYKIPKMEDIYAAA